MTFSGDADRPTRATDRYGRTPLLTAVEADDLETARALIAGGVDPRAGENISMRLREMGRGTDVPAHVVLEDVILTPAAAARSPEMVRLLVGSGVPPEAFEAADFPVAAGADLIRAETITPEMFKAQSRPRRGRANPEQVDIPFWREQIRTGRSGFAAETRILGARRQICGGDPVWSFDRFGRSTTRLPDGRLVVIGGEHEDHSDPDFYIYADVTVIGTEGTVAHYIYPEVVFPPTDFHTATLLDDHILLIGALGYPDRRREGETQVLRLELSDFSIRAVETTGTAPGWLHRHRAIRAGGGIEISGGRIEPGYRENPHRHRLDLSSMAWLRH